jgi:hypothetical protein
MIDTFCLDEDTTADDFTSRYLHDNDEQLWFRDGKGGWSIVSHDSWDQLTGRAEDTMMAECPLSVIALTKEEWEADTEDADDIIDRYENEMATSVEDV